jgi:hypothetical protein
MRPAPRVLAVLPALLLLAGCVGTPAPAETPLTSTQACAALEDAVVEFYDLASPNSTVTELETYALPEVNGFQIPKPSCAFQVRPDPAVIPGDVFTIENFYLDYEEELTVTLGDRLEDAGFAHGNSEFSTWSVNKLGHAYSAAIILSAPGDGQPYSEAAEHYRVLDLTIGQN